MDMKAIGVIGAGRMGLPIIGHLVRKGFDVRACDIDAGKRGAVEAKGARWEADASALASDADAILVCVGYDRDVQALLEPGGPLRAARADAIVAILSTVLPKTVQRLAHDAAASGIHVIDSTVCRGGEAADLGTLLSFVGGPPEVVVQITPVLRAYSSDVVHTGGVGTAQVAKAVNNLILRSEEHTSELQSRENLVCRLLLEK